jgi:hypothetical protein
MHNKASNVTNCEASEGRGSCSKGSTVPVWRFACHFYNLLTFGHLKMGFDYFVHIHIEVDGHLSVNEGNRIAHLVKDILLQKRFEGYKLFSACRAARVKYKKSSYKNF